MTPTTPTYLKVFLVITLLAYGIAFFLPFERATLGAFFLKCIGEVISQGVGPGKILVAFTVTLSTLISPVYFLLFFRTRWFGRYRLFSILLLLFSLIPLVGFGYLIFSKMGFEPNYLSGYFWVIVNVALFLLYHFRVRYWQQAQYNNQLSNHLIDQN